MKNKTVMIIFSTALIIAVILLNKWYSDDKVFNLLMSIFIATVSAYIVKREMKKEQENNISNTKKI